MLLLWLLLKLLLRGGDTARVTLDRMLLLLLLLGRRGKDCCFCLAAAAAAGPPVVDCDWFLRRRLADRHVEVAADVVVVVVDTRKTRRWLIGPSGRILLVPG